MLDAVLVEAGLLAGQVIPPRSPPAALARLTSPLRDDEDWSYLQCAHMSRKRHGYRTLRSETLELHLL